ncbi:MAG: VWA domain-containing protein [Thermoanaerobaculia bacterium]
MMRRACPVLLSFLFLGFNLLTVPGVLQAAVRADDAQVRSWLREVDLLITPREREVFQGLRSQADREAFIQRFWQVRDPYPETPRNEARERWEERLAEVRSRWGGDLQDDRARVFLINGEPGETFETRCAGQTLQVWTYPPQFQSRFRMTLVFHAGDKAPARLWRAGDTPDLSSRELGDCASDTSFAEAATWIRRVGKDTYAVVLQRALASPKPREWVSSFRPAAPEGHARARSLPVRLDVDFPGRQGEGIVRIQVAPGELPEQAARMLGDSREVFVSGRILRGNEMVDSFRYRFDAPATAGVTGARPLAFERRLGPGRYKLEVQLDAPAAGSSFVGERELAVPSVPAAVSAAAPAAVPAPPPSPEVQGLFAEADAALATPRPEVRILASEGKLIAGVQRIEARVDRAAGLPEAEQIERVTFSLDGRPLLTRNRAPYVAEIDLGRTPRSHRLTVEGMNGRGELLAKDQLELNAGGQRFAARLVEPQPGRPYRRSLRARVEVEAPADQALDRVELYLGEKRVATLYQPPFSQPLTLPDSGGIGYIRAVAYLADGTATEDTVLLNSPSTPEKMEIRLVELYTHVIDRAGKAVEGLGAGEVHVFEDGVRQSVRLVERVEDAPLRLVTLIDNSASMRPRLEPARQAALQFLRRTLRPRDQAAVITFNRSPHVAVGLTADLKALEDGLSGLMADEETSLYDSLIFSLQYLGGAPGQRAVLLLSDGEDHTSTFGFAEVLESARRAGIAVYAVGIDLPKGGPTEHLAKLAAETGGRSFFLRGTGGLDRAYQEIESDLRSRYRISYQSSNTKASDAFRAVRVELARPGVEARTISGYYP